LLFSVSSVKIKGGETMDNLRFAYLGDAVYELYIRKYLIEKKSIKKVKDLQETAINYVSAKSQVRILEKLINDNVLTLEEQDIVRQGRNASSHSSKSTDIVTYKRSTGFECLIGYLYENNIERCNFLLDYIVGNEL
jgi:ribonuclease-3 family protein